MADDGATLHLSVARPSAGLLPDPSVCCQTQRRQSQPFVCLLSLIKLNTKKECPLFVTASDLQWYAECYGQPLLYL